MTAIVEMIRQLRCETGAGVLECRRALEDSSGDYEEALAVLRKKAALKAEQQASREALQGRIESYSHNDGRVGVMVQIDTVTEFAGRSDVIRHLGREIALQVTAAAPLYVRDEDIPRHILEAEAQAASERAFASGKPAQIVEKIVAGALEKYQGTHVLLRQPYIRDDTITVAELVGRAIAQVGENVVIRRFVRWETNQEPDAS